MEEHEYQGYKIPELFEQDLIEGIEVLRFAIEDMNIPKEGPRLKNTKHSSRTS